MVQWNLSKYLGSRGRAARDSDIAAVPAIVHGEGVGFGARGEDFPGGVGPVGRDSRPSRGEARESLCCSALWRLPLQGLGRSGVEGGVLEPHFAWAVVRVDPCQYDEGPCSKPHEVTTG